MDNILDKYPRVRLITRFVAGRTSPAGGLVLICVIGLLLYARILNAPFQFDDIRMIQENWMIRDLDNISNIWNEIKYPKLCFLTFLSFALNYHFGAYETFWYHLVNVLLHIAVTCLFYVWLLTLFDSPFMRRSGFAGSKQTFSLFAALIFLAHPLQTQAVTYIWSRTEVLSAFFGMLSLVLYVKGRMSAGLIYFPLAFLLFLIGIFTRGNIIVLPLLALLTEITFFDLNFDRVKQGFSRRRVVAGCVMFAIIAGLIYFIAYSGFLNVPWLLDEPAYSRFTYILTQFKVVVKYIQLAFLPFSQNLDYYFPLSVSFFEAGTLLSCLVLVLVLALAWVRFPRQRLVSFGIFWFFIALVPVSTILVLSVVISESRLYFPMIGFSVFITALIFSLPRQQNIKNSILAGIIVVLGVLTLMRNELWRSPIALMEDTVSKSPRHYRPHSTLGMLYARAGRVEEAAQEFNKSIALNPEYLPAYNNLGALYWRRGEYEKAQELFTQIIETDPKYLHAYLNLGYMNLARRKFWETEDIFRKSMLRCGPTEEALVGLADNYMARREYSPEEMDKAAIARLNWAIEINPRSRKAYDRLAKAYVLERDYGQALKTVQKWLTIEPGDYQAYINLGRVYELLNDADRARQAFEKAMAMDPGKAQAYDELGNFYFSLRQFDKARAYYAEAARRVRAGGQDEY